MNHPALQVTPTQRYAQTIRARLITPPNAYRPPVALPEPPKPQPKRRLRVEVQHDAHVIDWQAKKEAYDAIEVEARKVSCRDYIKKRCAELGVSYADVISEKRLKPISEARQLIMFEIKTEVKPSISFSELGALFGGRDSTTCRHACERHGWTGEGWKTSEIKLAQIRELHAAGLNNKVIAEKLGISQSTVSRCVRSVSRSKKARAAG